MPRVSAVAALAFACLVGLAGAKTLRWSSQGDYLTADPMAQNELLTNSINGQVYESLVMRGKKLEILPGLAESWKQTGPTTWIFNLRRGVKWQDGSDFTADDVVFSMKRLQGPTLATSACTATPSARRRRSTTTPSSSPRPCPTR